MPFEHGLCRSYKLEILRGEHSYKDRYKIALYAEGATLTKTTPTYTPAGEISSNWYIAGGQILTGFTCGLNGDIAYAYWKGDPTWGPAATLSARGALIYNSSKENKAVGVVDFGEVYSCKNGTLRIPIPGKNNPLIQIF